MVNFIKDYIDNRIQLIKLGVVSVMANLTANLISSFLILLMLLIILFMFSISLAYFIGQEYNNTALGFAIVGGIYIAIFAIYMIFAKKNMDTKVKDKIVQAAFAAEKELVEENKEL